MAITANDKARFCYEMAKHTQATFAQCQRLLRLAASLHRFDVERCNRKFTERDERKIVNYRARVLRICNEINEAMGLDHRIDLLARRPAVVKPWFSDEPMAPAVVIQVPDGFSNYTGEVKGIGVPA